MSECVSGERGVGADRLQAVSPPFLSIPSDVSWRNWRKLLLISHSVCEIFKRLVFKYSAAMCWRARASAIVSTDKITYFVCVCEINV